MVSPELGTKRICPSCAARFYDLNKNPAVCPKCATAFVAESLLPSKGEAALAPKPPRPVAEPNDLEEVADVELVSLDEVDDGTDDVDDETAGIEDVDLGEDVAGDAGEEDVFLEEEEDDDNVSGIIGGSKDDDEGL